MATLIGNLLGNSSKNAELTEEMRTVLREMRTERSHCEALVKSARASLARIQELGEPIVKAESEMDAATARLAGLEQRLAAFETLAAQFQSLDERAERLGQSQRQAEARIAHSAEDAERTRSLLEDLSQKVDQALALRDQIGSFLEVEAPFRHLRSDAEELRAQMAGANERLTRLHEQHERVMDTHKSGLAKMTAFDRRHEELARAMQEKERRVAGVEQALRRLDVVPQIVDETKRRVETLKALGDQVVQKTSALEAQRQAVERAAARADQLDQAMRQIDAGVRQQQENAKALNVIKEQIGGLQSVYDVVAQRSRDIEQVQRGHDERVAVIGAELAKAQDAMQKSVERIEFENRGLESVSQRVADLRSALADFEARFAGLAESKQSVEALQSQTDGLATQLASIAGEIGNLDGDAYKIRALRQDLDRLVTAASDADERVVRIQEAAPAIEAAVRDVQQLQGTHALVKDALEQTQVAANEISRIREEQSETRSWLAGIKESFGHLEVQATELTKMAPTLEFVEKQVQRVTESMAAVESRREFVEDMHRRLAEQGALGAALDDRSRDLQTRMEAAEQRFVGLAAHADEADRIGKTIAGVAASLQEAEQQTSDILKSITSVEARCESVESLAERTRVLRQDLEQRQHALEEASEQFQSVSELRQEAAASAQELEERTKRLAASLSSADREAERVQEITGQLEQRASGLRFVEKRLVQFEDQLGKWEIVEQEIARSLELLSGRQATVEALQADVDRMFLVAEKTSADVRAITSAQREIEESRALLNSVMDQVREVGQMTSALDERKRQMVEAESRLAQAEALLMDVRSSLAVLHGQKIIIDQAVEKAGSLQFLLKQAELMIDDLREEREVTTRVRAAMSAIEVEHGPEAAEQVPKAG